MQQRTIYVDTQKRHHMTPVEGAVEMLELSAENGKVLVHPAVDGEWIVIAVESADGWREEDGSIDDSLSDTEALELLIGGTE